MFIAISFRLCLYRLINTCCMAFLWSKVGANVCLHLELHLLNTTNTWLCSVGGKKRAVQTCLKSFALGVYAHANARTQVSKRLLKKNDSRSKCIWQSHKDFSLRFCLQQQSKFLQPRRARPSGFKRFIIWSVFHIIVILQPCVVYHMLLPVFVSVGAGGDWAGWRRGGMWDYSIWRLLSFVCQICREPNLKLWSVYSCQLFVWSF